MANLNDERLESRFWSKISPDPESGCWRWVGGLGPHGYGKYWSEGKTKGQAHKMVYEKLVGPVPEGLELDHLCRVRCCVNPDHLEPVTHAENIRRSPLIAQAFSERVEEQKAITHCPKGHEYSGANLYVDKRGCRVCKTCRREAQKAWASRPENRESERLKAEAFRKANPEIQRERMRRSYHKKMALKRASKEPDHG